jgi:hypothetical protein
MNEMMYMPLMWVIILGTALLSAVVTVALPYMPQWWNAFKSRIKRKSNATDIVDIIIISQLTERVDDLQKQIDNLVEVKYNRDRNRKNNIKRDVRDYLKELQND